MKSCKRVKRSSRGQLFKGQRGQVKRHLGDIGVIGGTSDSLKVRDYPENREISLGIKAIHGSQRVWGQWVHQGAVEVNQEASKGDTRFQSSEANRTEFQEVCQRL